MEAGIIPVKKHLHIGYPWMLGRIIEMKRGPKYDIVTVRYQNEDTEDKVFTVENVD